VRPLCSLLGLGVLLLARAAAAAPSGTHPYVTTQTAAAAQDHPLVRLVESERRSRRHVVEAGSITGTPRPPALVEETSALDCEHAVHDIRIDPVGGATNATLDLRVRANGKPLASVGLTFDEGLQVLSANADGRAALVTQAIYTPTRVVRIALSPPLPAGESTVLHVAYGGVLACGSFPEGGAVLCTKSDEFSYFGQQSVYPHFFDPADPQSATLDALTRDITLRVPSDVDVVATGERLGETIEGGMRVSRWTIDRPLSRVLGMYLFAGKLGRLGVSGRSVPTTLVFPNLQPLPIDQRLVSWSKPVLDFVEHFAGVPLPFQRSLTLVRLPADVGDPGTATFGMTLLSETYARAGEIMHEETWAHENTHLFWGIIVPERSWLESRMMSEGLATLSEIDYTWSRHFASEDRDRYLARRFIPIGVDLRTMGKDLPPIAVAGNNWQVDGFHTAVYTMWAYTKTAATLDHLRVTLGEDVFAKALASYIAQCSYVGCSPTDFREVLERASGEDLRPFFDRWVTATSRPIVDVGFAAVEGGVDVELAKADAMPMTLELWLRLEGDRLVKQRVALKGRSTVVHIDTPAPVRSVSVSPRHDLMVSSRSAVEGDLDFDGETDGADMIRCSRLFGKSYRSPNGLGLWNIEETFDPRCDLNDDLRIDDEDLDLLAKSFGKLRQP
jgi:hypothetical protein